MTENDFCSHDCPYLKRFSENGKLPFYCELFKVFLAIKNNQILRTELCIGKHLGTKETGYNFINAIQDENVNKTLTKRGFHKLEPLVQLQFVAIMQKQGIEMGIKNDTTNDNLLISQLITQIKENAPTEEGHHTTSKSFNYLLDSLADVAPDLLNEANKNLLKNLFMVMDGSEQSAVAEILSNPDKAENFLKSFDDLPKTENLLKDFRRLLDETEKEGSKDDRTRQQEAYKLRQQELARQMEAERRQQEMEEEKRRSRAAAKEWEHSIRLIKENDKKNTEKKQIEEFFVKKTTEIEEDKLRQKDVPTKSPNANEQTDNQDIRIKLIEKIHIKDR